MKLSTYVSKIENVSNLGTFSLLIFFIVILFVIFLVWKMNPRDLEYLSEMPLEKENNDL
ncbi:MAG: hypothetical protein MUE53_03270 [Chitinophagales bacterium]|jgi:hypothetical protein|nr:hypothetical protein [Chitinophagales bacterium]